MNTEKLTPETVFNKFKGLLMFVPHWSSLTDKIKIAHGAIAEFGQQEYQRGKAEANQWISVEDQLPEMYRPLFVVNNGMVHRAHHNQRVFKRSIGQMRELEKVTHWCYDDLPAPPQQGKEGEA